MIDVDSGNLPRSVDGFTGHISGELTIPNDKNTIDNDMAYPFRKRQSVIRFIVDFSTMDKLPTNDMAGPVHGSRFEEALSLRPKFQPQGRVLILRCVTAGNPDQDDVMGMES